jgi:hypothetical protein
MLVDGSVQSHWACQDPATPACPLSRPSLGSACTQNGLFCNYGGCSVPGGTAVQCEGNLWQEALVACAAAQ